MSAARPQPLTEPRLAELEQAAQALAVRVQTVRQAAVLAVRVALVVRMAAAPVERAEQVAQAVVAL